MKLFTLFLLAAALVAGHDTRDDNGWSKHNPPPVAAPEPATYAMMAVGLGVVILVARNRGKK